MHSVDAASSCVVVAAAAAVDVVVASSCVVVVVVVVFGCGSEVKAQSGVGCSSSMDLPLPDLSLEDCQQHTVNKQSACSQRTVDIELTDGLRQTVNSVAAVAVAVDCSKQLSRSSSSSGSRL